MSRLIDADDLIQIIDTASDDLSERLKKVFIDIVAEQPTAYDVERVAAELEIAKEKVAKEDYCRTKHYIENDCEHKDCFLCCAEYLIDIVKKGGIEN